MELARVDVPLFSSPAPTKDCARLSPRQQVRKLAIEDGLHPQEITSRMQGVLSRNTVRQYVKEAYAAFRKEGIALPPIPRNEKLKGRHPHSQARASISPTHVRVGAMINRLRTETGLDAPTFAQRLGFSNQMSLRSMELGMHDFTLSELQRLASVLSLRLSKLLQPSPILDNGCTAVGTGDVRACR